MDEDVILKEHMPFEDEDRRSILLKWIIVCMLFYFLTFFLLLFILNNSIPKEFPTGSYLTIEKGISLKSVSEILEEKKYITSAELFYYKARIRGVSGVVSGEYFFKNKENISSITRRLTIGEYGYAPILMTVPEGFTREQISSLCGKLLQSCNKIDFLNKTIDLEGYLFPATYSFTPTTTTDQVVEKMYSTYKKRLIPFQDGFKKQNMSEKEVITFASILEREARGYEEQRIVAGILYRRLRENMPLQVDAPFYFLYGKKSSDLSLSDLRSDNPYNTYIHKGLPPTPIGNPGIDAIKATLNPVETSYYFYLHGDDGLIHYAATYQEHLRNKKLYIR